MFDFLWKQGTCQACRSHGALVSRWSSKVKCRNAACPNFDIETQQRPFLPSSPAASVPLRGDFHPGSAGVTLRYVNHRGEERSYTAERASVRQKGEHITAKLEPTGKRVSFSKKYLRNLAEVQTLVSRAAEADEIWRSLSAVEHQIVGYHRKRKTTSPRYEALLRKYPKLG